MQLKCDMNLKKTLNEISKDPHIPVVMASNKNVENPKNAMPYELPLGSDVLGKKLIKYKNRFYYFKLSSTILKSMIALPFFYCEYNLLEKNSKNDVSYMVHN